MISSIKAKTVHCGIITGWNPHSVHHLLLIKYYRMACLHLAISFDPRLVICKQPRGLTYFKMPGNILSRLGFVNTISSFHLLLADEEQQNSFVSLIARIITHRIPSHYSVRLRFGKILVDCCQSPVRTSFERPLFPRQQCRPIFVRGSSCWPAAAAVVSLAVSSSRRGCWSDPFLER